MANLRPISVLITGSDKGIGLEMVKQFCKLPSPPQYIFAAGLNPKSSKKLCALASENNNVHLIQHDVRDHDNLQKVVQEVHNVLDDRGLNLLVNMAGIYDPINFKDTTAESIRQHFEVNALGPFMLFKALQPLLEKGSQQSSQPGMSCSKSAVINISSRHASVGTVGGPGIESDAGLIGYRVSKASLNMMTKVMSMEFEKDDILCIVVHPGHVKNEMGGPKGEISEEESVEGMLNVMAGLDASKTGVFLDYKNKAMQW